MDYDKIKDLIHTIDDSRFTDFELRLDGDMYVRMNKNGVQNDREVKPAEKSEVISEKISEKTEIKITEPITIIPEDNVEVKEGNIVTSPMVGTFYEAAAPSKPPFKKVGDKVQKGDVLCVIEAMKIMNEIASQYDGQVAEILAKNEEMVEYGQPLFRII